jgi:hypothetical protein
MDTNMIVSAIALVGVAVLLAGVRLADLTTAAADERGEPDGRYRINEAAWSRPGSPRASAAVA